MTDTAINLLWGLFFVIVNFSMVLLSYYLFGRTGMFVWIAIATIIANIQVTKTINLFGYAATLGNVFYGSIFLATDILNEKYGKKEANRSVLIGFFVDVVIIIAMQMALFFVPDETDIAQGSLETIFGLVPRICLASLCGYLVSQFLDIAIFNRIRTKSNGKFMWVRNNAATMISQLFDTSIFVFISFTGVYDIGIVMEIFATTYILKFVVAVLDTPFLYISKLIKPGILVGESPCKGVDAILSLKNKCVAKVFKKNTPAEENKAEEKTDDEQTK